MIKKENIVKKIRNCITEALEKGFVEKDFFICSIDSSDIYNSFKSEFNSDTATDYELYELFLKAFENDQDVCLYVRGWYGYRDDAPLYHIYAAINGTFIDQAEYNNINVKQISKITKEGIGVSFEIYGDTSRRTKICKFETLAADIKEYSGVDYSEELEALQEYKTLYSLFNYLKN